MNFLDYLKKNKMPFEKVKFNEIDGLAFSALSYIRFERVFKEKNIPIKDIVIKFSSFDKKQRKKHYMFENDERLIESLSMSNRMIKLEIIDHKLFFDNILASQFFGFATRISEKEIVVTFRGTDETLLGWYEAIKLGFSNKVTGQEKAKNYLEELIKKYPDNKFYVVGHSKGGNFAIYAVSALDRKYQKNIMKVYNYDGPQLLDSQKKETNYKNVKSRIITFIPKASVVGISLGIDGITRIVESVGLSVAQHVYYYWKVDGIHFVIAKRRTLYSLAFEKSFSDWLKSMDKKQMAMYVDITFKWLGEAKIEKVEDFLDIHKFGKFIKVINLEKDKNKKAFGEKLIELFLSYMKNSALIGINGYKLNK